MALTIQKKYQYIEYLGNDISINQLPNVSQIESIIGISDDGESFTSWSYNSSLNSLSEMINQRGYLIVSKNLNPNYPLYTEADTASPASRIIDKKLSITKYINNTNQNISNLQVKDSINQIFSFSIDGRNPVSWSFGSALNSLNVMENGSVYLIDSKRASLPYYFWSLIPPTQTPTPSLTCTATPTFTPTNTLTPTTTPTSTATSTVTPSVTITRTATSSATPTPTATPTTTPYPPDTSYSIAFDNNIYYFKNDSNNFEESNLVSATLIGKPNTIYTYIFSSESNNSTILFDNPSGVLSLDYVDGVSLGKIFTNIKTNNQHGQSIIKCTAYENTNNRIDTLCVVLINSPMGEEPAPSIPIILPSKDLATIVGNGVLVFSEALDGFKLSLIYSNVTVAGTTTITKLKQPDSPNNLPANFRVGDTLASFNVNTTASFTGGVKMCFVLPSNTSQTVFNSTRIFHLDSAGNATDATILTGDDAPNFSNKTICASVNSFSQFLIIPSYVLAPIVYPPN
jgi:hypothetical protein